MNEPDGHLHWETVDSKLVKRCGIFDLYESKRRAQDGREGVFHLLEAPDWVNVVPVVRDGRGRTCFLMVRQYRQGISRTTVEFPAGLIEAGESPEAAAGRELYEETGYRSESLKPIGTIYPNPAFMTNRCYTFLARNLHPENGAREPAERPVEGENRLDELELLDALLVPIDTVVAEIGRGPFCNSMTVLALYWYQRLNNGDGKTGADRIRTGA
jgi:8-oxo-dGTP pyrophosphatase MutT (NUDIX family)